VKSLVVRHGGFGGSNLFSGLRTLSDLENSTKLAGELKIPRSRYVPVARRSAFGLGNLAHCGQAQSSEDPCLESDDSKCRCIRDGCARRHHPARGSYLAAGPFAPPPCRRFCPCLLESLGQRL